MMATKKPIKSNAESPQAAPNPIADAFVGAVEPIEKLPSTLPTAKAISWGSDSRAPMSPEDIR